MEYTTISAGTLRDLEAIVENDLCREFYLAGGTGLAMHLAHRESHDLDFFTEVAFGEDALITRLESMGTFALEKKETGTVRGTFRDTVVSFFYYPYPLLEEPAVQKGVRVASVRDIGCMKMDAIASRGAKRDFVDLYAIIHTAGMSLSRLTEMFAKKYARVHYNLMHIKKGLVYFTDAEGEPMPRMPEPMAWDTIKEFFIAEVSKL